MDSLISSAVQQQQSLQSMQIGTSVLKKTIDVQKSMSEAILTLLDSAMASPAIGKSLGMGRNLDVMG